jgi:hypothetical protein
LPASIVRKSAGTLSAVIEVGSIVTATRDTPNFAGSKSSFASKRVKRPVYDEKPR